MNCSAVDIVYLYVMLTDYLLVLFDCKQTRINHLFTVVQIKL